MNDDGKRGARARAGACHQAVVGPDHLCGVEESDPRPPSVPPFRHRAEAFKDRVLAKS